MAAVGLGADLLLANEVLNTERLGRIAGARVTVAVDSEATIDAAARGGVREVLIDINVGVPRCGLDRVDSQGNPTEAPAAVAIEEEPMLVP